MKILYFVKPKDLAISEDEIIKSLPAPNEYIPNFILADDKRNTDNIKPYDIGSIASQNIVKDSISSGLSKGAIAALSSGVPGVLILGSAWLGTSIYD